MWMISMNIVDANVVLRYLLDDHPELSARAEEIIEQNAVVLPIEVACEVVYVLQKVYSVDRVEIQNQLTQLLHDELVSMDKSEVFLEALNCYSHSKLDFVDALLWAYNQVEQHHIFTFDKKLNKLIQN